MRVPSSSPVITYQDNLQIHRTSLRHLRMSKLEKDKKKQDKIWDFTVRGWRVADTCGIERLFYDPVTAKKSQRSVSDLKFEDTAIGGCYMTFLDKSRILHVRAQIQILYLCVEVIPHE